MAEFTTLPDAPTNTSLDTSVENEITISWKDNSSSESGYRVYRSTDGSSFSQTADLAANTTSYTDTGLLDGEKYWYYVTSYTSGSENAGSTVNGITVLPAPSSVSASVVANDQIDVSWNANLNNGAIRIRVSRDGNTFTRPAMNDTLAPSATSATYTPASDEPYDSVVGIDSSFVFQVRSQTEHTASAYVDSGTVYTDPLPPHNPSVNRPDANTIEVTASNTSDAATNGQIQYRLDTGNGFGSWNQLESFFLPSEGNSYTRTYSVSNGDLQEDARYQIRLRHYIYDNSNRGNSEWVYADYGNEGNVYFEGDFESGDLSAWKTYGVDSGDADSGIQSGGFTDLGIDGADQGTYYCRLDAGDDIRKKIGSISSDTDVIVRATVATGSMDSAGEQTYIEWYDGSNYQTLRTFSHEYNRQGWTQVTAVVPSSYFNSNNHVRFRGYGGVSDHFAVDRVVVSDILHEYTKPARPTNLSLDVTAENEISASFSQAKTFPSKNKYRIELNLDGTKQETNWSGSTETTFVGLSDGEQYEVSAESLIDAHYHGEDVAGQFSGRENAYYSDKVAETTTTKLPPPTTLSASTTGPNTADLSWTENHNYGDQRVYLRETGTKAGMDFSAGNNVTVQQSGSLDPSNVYFNNNSLTVSAWLKFNELRDLSTTRRFISTYYHWRGGYGIHVRQASTNENSIVATSPTEGEFNEVQYNVTTTDVEFHTVARYDSGTVELFIDGVSAGTHSYTSFDAPDGEPFEIGGLDNGGRNFDGKIRDVAVWNRPLSESEISTVYNGGMVGNGLIGHWPLDQNNSGTTPDVSPYNNDGTVNGATLVGNTPTDDSGSLSLGTSSYTVSGLTDDTDYEAFIQSETEHSKTRDY